MTERLTINVGELSEQLGISKPKAYELVKRADFPAILIGKRIIIPIEALQIWLMNNAASSKNEKHLSHR